MHARANSIVTQARPEKCPPKHSLQTSSGFSVAGQSQEVEKMKEELQDKLDVLTHLITRARSSTDADHERNFSALLPGVSRLLPDRPDRLRPKNTKLNSWPDLSADGSTGHAGDKGRLKADTRGPGALGLRGQPERRDEDADDTASHDHATSSTCRSLDAVPLHVETPECHSRNLSLVESTTQQTDSALTAPLNAHEACPHTTWNQTERSLFPTHFSDTRGNHFRPSRSATREPPGGACPPALSGEPEQVVFSSQWRTGQKATAPGAEVTYQEHHRHNDALSLSADESLPSVAEEDLPPLSDRSVLAEARLFSPAERNAATSLPIDRCIRPAQEMHFNTDGTRTNSGVGVSLNAAPPKADWKHGASCDIASGSSSSCNCASSGTEEALSRLDTAAGPLEMSGGLQPENWRRKYSRESQRDFSAQTAQADRFSQSRTTQRSRRRSEAVSVICQDAPTSTGGSLTGPSQAFSCSSFENNRELAPHVAPVPGLVSFNSPRELFLRPPAVANLPEVSSSVILGPPPYITCQGIPQYADPVVMMHQQPIASCLSPRALPAPHPALIASNVPLSAQPIAASASGGPSMPLPGAAIAQGAARVPQQMRRTASSSSVLPLRRPSSSSVFFPQPYSSSGGGVVLVAQPTQCGRPWLQAAPECVATGGPSGVSSQGFGIYSGVPTACRAVCTANGPNTEPSSQTVSAVPSAVPPQLFWPPPVQQPEPCVGPNPC